MAEREPAEKLPQEKGRRKVMKRTVLLVLVLCMMLFTGVCAFCEAATVSEATVMEATASEATASEAAAQLDPAWKTFLLIGSDSRMDSLDGRADALIVCAVHEDTGAIRLISLTRDMYIKLPDSEAHNRINTAFRFGGPERMMDAVNETLGLQIEQYAAVNFRGFCDVIDVLDGITVTLAPGEAAVINKTADGNNYNRTEIVPIPYKAETATLCGAQALAFARIRKIDSDFARNGRQRDVVVAVLEKVKTLSFTQQLAFVKECLSCVETNMGLGDIVSLGTLVLGHGFDDIMQLSLPSQGNYRYASIEGMSVVVFDEEATRREALEFIYGGIE